MFGNKNGSDSSKPAFGAANGAASGGFTFGQPSGDASKPTFSFGSASDKPAATPAFGSASGASADKPAESKPLFGQQTQGSLFGAKPDAKSDSGDKPAGGLFGASGSASAAKPAFAFGSSDKPAAAPTFGSGSSLFGAKEPAKDAAKDASNEPAKPAFGLGGAAFGSSDKKETPLFGAKKETTLGDKKETPLFGEKQTPLFGAASDKKDTTTPTFGAPEKKDNPLFGSASSASSTTSKPLFGEKKDEKPLFGEKKDDKPVFGEKKDDKPVFGEKKDDKPTFGASDKPTFGASTDKPADKPTFGAASTEKKQEITPSMYMRNKSFEDIISKWTSALNTSQKQFQDQAQDIAKWDRVLVENGTKISNTWSEVQGLELQQTRIDDLLNYIDGQQTSLEQMLDKYEASLESASKFDHLQPADQERKEAYGLAESLETRLDDFETSLTSLIGEINKISQNANQIKDEDPIGPVLRILNSHLASMEWIEDNASQLQDKLQQVYARNAKTHIPSAWN